MRSMPWSKMFPSWVEVTVTRASLPSTVSRNVMTQPASKPQPYSPRANSTSATITSARLIAVTWLGVIPARAHQRVTCCAGAGQSHLVTRSVTPL
ncbi:hypothetical protein D3C83_12470 [compost metagenome]